MSILQTSDFVAEYKVGQDSFTNLDTYITTYEKHYLVRIMGKALYDLFIADLTGPTPQVTQTARFNNLFNPFEIDDGNSLFISEGMKIMLIQLIYFHYTRDQEYKKTPSGTKILDGSISLSKPHSGDIVEKYNRAIDNYRAIQWFIDDNSSTYPEENMQFSLKMSGI